MSSNTLCIRFIRKNAPQSGKRDDRVFIQPVSLNLYELIYKDGNKHSGRTNRVVLNEYSVFQYVCNIIDLYSMDADPFESIQFDFPLMPSVLISIMSLDASRSALLSAIQFHLNHLIPPFQQKTEPVVKPGNNKVNSEKNRILQARIQHIFFDE